MKVQEKGHEKGQKKEERKKEGGVERRKALTPANIELWREHTAKIGAFLKEADLVKRGKCTSSLNASRASKKSEEEKLRK